MRSRIGFGWLLVCLVASASLAVVAQNPQTAESRNRDRVGLNFIRPDVGRPGNYDFKTNGVWLAEQLNDMSVRWTRIAFSWVLVQPSKNQFDWSAYDRIVDACTAKHIQILATLGGHFDSPPVPAWAGKSLEDVITNHPEFLQTFIGAWVSRYKDRIHYWEILNEPDGQHLDLTLRDYVEKILKPSFRIIKTADPEAKVLPCSYNHLPSAGSVLQPRESFWDMARGYYDIANVHEYADWDIFRTQPVANEEEQHLREFRELMEKHGEGSKPFWVTEIGWWGTGSLLNKHEVYRKDPESGEEFKPIYRGQDILSDPVEMREDQLRVEWMKDLFPRLASIPGCQRIFLWSSMDEFEGGYHATKDYGLNAAQFDLWGVIAGDKTWRKSAYALREILRAN